MKCWIWWLWHTLTYFDILWPFFLKVLMEVGIAVRNVRLWRILWFKPCRSVLAVCAALIRQRSPWHAHFVHAFHRSLWGRSEKAGRFCECSRCTWALAARSEMIQMDVKTLRIFGWWRCRTGLLTGNSMKHLDWIGYIRYVIVPVMYKCIYIYILYYIILYHIYDIYTTCICSMMPPYFRLFAGTFLKTRVSRRSSSPGTPRRPSTWWPGPGVQRTSRASSPVLWCPWWVIISDDNSDDNSGNLSGNISDYDS